MDTPVPISLSVVLLAYNEAESVAQAVADVRSVCRRWVRQYEIIAVDDGSTDETPRRLEQERGPDLRVITHPTNQGMGASLRDGYRAARMDYATFLPADRQLRADTVPAYLPFVAPDAVVVSDYDHPHSGPARKVLSLGFRACLRAVAGLHVNFEGSYVFPTALFHRADPPDAVASSTFLYSFQLLEGLVAAGCAVHRIRVSPMPREAGSSKVANWRRIRTVWSELVRHRRSRTAVDGQSREN